ncbi:6-carboxytetrahydropterin synthase [Shewanella surugensis]|uniref:6-carboxy-5,6,7,8-tetrahydropterin synthase n=1 Tax=Shewanella surugensis TaxID=212020 RepID=A0ABT0LJT9_9GAMM|nr:6-carboxytetrahydropterin synthase [Shewanella surugensis]MCL1127961.1 6-carboxytetrahydropterin synthase [Shewanella surugensis]
MHETSYQTHFNAARHVIFSNEPVGEDGNLSGYRYTVQVKCLSCDQDKPTDMTIIKNIINVTLKNHFDHALILAFDDPIIDRIFEVTMRDKMLGGTKFSQGDAWYGKSEVGKVAVLPYAPISENLARFFFKKLTLSVNQLAPIDFRLASVKVWETPNWCSEYPVN